MGEYSKYINLKRRPVKTPSAIIDQDGNSVFGTFDGEFETLNLVKAKKPTLAPQAFNKLKLTLWEAAEIFLDNGILLTSVCDMGIIGKTYCIFYDKRTKEVYCWDNNLRSKDTIIAPNLLNGSASWAKTKRSRIEFINNFDLGKCSLEGEHNGNSGNISYSFKLEKIAPPSVVSVPFGKNRPLYAEKMFFKVKGNLEINGEKMTATRDSCAVVDDHRGYYPRKSHYDWITSMGKYDFNGKRGYFAFNLTRNQSLDPEEYNEDLIWLNNKTSILPPVDFIHDKQTKDFDGNAVWAIRDKHDMVNVNFNINAVNPMVLHALIIKIDYYVVFGELEGYLRTKNGDKITLDGMPAIGEDKTLLL